MTLAPYMPPGQPVPSPVAFPAPAPSNPNPFVGTSAPITASTPLSQASASALSAAGIPASTEMTPQEAVAQSETALAKLAQVNPQLAQELLEKRTDSGSGGIFGFLKDVGSAVLSPALSMGGELLEIIGRTSHIVPQWFDPEDKGNWFEDVGQALAGEDKTNWNEVFQHRGWLENAGWLRATVGFGLDIATDPLTYATFGAGAGVSTVERGANAARIAAVGIAEKGGAKIASPFVERLATLSGKGLDEAAAMMQRAWTVAAGQTDSLAAVAKYADGGAEEIMGVIGRANESEVRMLVADAFDAGSQAYRKVYARTWKNFLQRGDNLYSSIPGEESRVLLSADQAKPLFEAVARGGNFTSYRAGEWGAAKAAAGSMGGLRFRFAVPFTQFRYISPMVPQSWRLGLGSVSRFATGFSGFKVVEKLGPEAEALFNERGWKGVAELAEGGDELAKEIVGKVRAGRAPYARSAFYAASERAGSLTAHLAPGARQFRMGLGYYFYRHGARFAADAKARLTNDMFYSVVGDATGEANRIELMRRYDRVWGEKAMRRLAKKADPGTVEQLTRDARKYVDYFGHEGIPHTPADVRAGRLDDWFWHSTPERTEQFLKAKQYGPNVPNPNAAEYAKQVAILEDMKRVLTTVKDDRALVLDDLVKTEAFGKTTVERAGGDIGDAAMELAEMRVIHPEDVAAHFPKRPEWLSQDFQAPLTAGKTLPATKYTGITADMSVPHEDLGVAGVRLDLTGGGTDTVPVQLRIQNVQDVDLNDLENVVPATKETIDAGTATLPQILAAYDKAAEEFGQDMAKQLHPLFDNHILRRENDLIDRAKAATEVLRRGPNPPDAVRFFRGDTPESMVVLDWTKVHHVTDTAPLARPRGGYWRRVLNPALRAKLYGEARKDTARLFGDPGAVEASFRRETRNMTLDEAEAYIRAKVNDAKGPYEGITIEDGEDVFDWDVLRGHEAYTKYLGDTYYEHAMGNLSKRMMALGQLVPPQFGNVAASDRAMFSMPKARMADLARRDKAVQDAFIKLSKRMDDEEARQFKTLVERHDRLSQALAYMEAGLSADDVPNNGMARAVDDLVRAGGNLQKVVAEETRRLDTKLARLGEDLAVTRKVQEDLQVPEWEDLDAYILSKRDPGTTPDDFRPEPSTDSVWDDETAFLNRAKEKGVATDLGDGVWRYRRTFGFNEDVYIATDESGRAVGYRAISKDAPEGAGRRPSSQYRVIKDESRASDQHWVIHDPSERVHIDAYPTKAEADAALEQLDREYDDALPDADAGAVVTAVAEDLQGQGYGMKLILAHWRAEGVTDFAGVKRMVSDQSFSDAGLRLNQRAARRILAENGIVDPETVQDLLKRGELYADKDGNILTKAGGIRKGGRRVRAADDVLSEMQGIRSLQGELDDLRRGAPVRVRDVQAEQAARGGLSDVEEAAAQDAFAAKLFGMADEAAATGMTRAQRRAAGRFTSAGEALETSTLRDLARSEKAAFKRGGIESRIHEKVTAASTEFNKARMRLEDAWADVKPALTFDVPPEGGKSLLRQVQIPGLGGVYAHPYMAEELEYLFRGKPVGHLRNLWREYLLGPWKRWATYRNPGFHVRNYFGAWFNNKLGGVDVLDEEFSLRVNFARGNLKGWRTRAVGDGNKDWERLNFENIAPGLKGKLTYGDVSEMLADQGMGRANTKATALTMAGESVSERARGVTGSALQKLDDKLRNVGGLTEDFHRTAAWAAGMRHTKGDLYGSRAFVMVRHGDYADLTETEDFIRDLVPFYKWMRTNVPYQLRMLAENPGYFTAVADKAQTYVYDVQGLNRYQEEFKQPEWMQRGFTIPVPKDVPFIGGQFISEDLPYTDLYNGARDYLSAGLPIIRNVVESFGIKQSVFTGAPLGNRMVPLSGIFDNPVMEPVIAALPWAQRGPDGRVYIPDTLDNVMTAIPIYSRFHNWMLSDPNRVENRVSTFTSALLGFGIRQDDLTAAELAFYYDELVPAMDRARSMGVELPTAQQLADAGVAIRGYGAAPNAEELFPNGVAEVAKE